MHVQRGRFRAEDDISMVEAIEEVDEGVGGDGGEMGACPSTAVGHLLAECPAREIAREIARVAREHAGVARIVPVPMVYEG